MNEIFKRFLVRKTARIAGYFKVFLTKNRLKIEVQWMSQHLKMIRFGYSRSYRKNPPYRLVAFINSGDRSFNEEGTLLAPAPAPTPGSSAGIAP